jgi:hypothetical protein
MAEPIRSIPVLKGEVATRFEREARKAESERGSIRIPKERVAVFDAIIDDYRKTFRH